MRLPLLHKLVIIGVVLHTSLFSQHESDDNRQKFINEMVPAIQQVNNEILQQRQGIYKVFNKFKSGISLSAHEKSLIYRYLKFYRCEVPDDTLTFQITSNHFKQLLIKVDVIPIKLVLAQSALESNWGNSRFAVEGNNLFGIRCYSKGCGLKPSDTGGEKFMVKKYPDLIDGLRDYFRLLNASSYYARFRELRMINRMNGHPPIAEEIVNGLENFSSLRHQYIEKLTIIMKTNFYHF